MIGIDNLSLIIYIYPINQSSIKTPNILLNLPSHAQSFRLSDMSSTRQRQRQRKSRNRTRNKDKDDAPLVEEVLQLPVLDELWICNEDREMQEVLKENDW